jgi:phosphoribosylanthranilate isomerase
MDAVLPGGTGHAFDWSLMRQWRGATPWMLAGGLTPENVAQAIAESGATAVDVSSGVEDAPGVKDPAAIQRFVLAAQSART